MYSLFLSIALQLASDSATLISGFVVDARTSKPIVGAQVFVSGDKLNSPCSTTNEGKFDCRLASVQPGTLLTITVQANGYARIRVNEPFVLGHAVGPLKLTPVSGQPPTQHERVRQNSKSDSVTLSAIEELLELGWTIKPNRDHTFLFQASGSVPSMDRSSLLLERLNRPFEVDLLFANFPEGLEHLNAAKNFRSLNLSSGKLSGTSSLSRLVNLESLTLDQTQIEDQDFSGLGALRHLKTLSLGRTKIRDLTPLSKLDSLEALGVEDDFALSDINPIFRLPSLKSLDISGSSVRDLSGMCVVNTIEQLTVSPSQVDGFAHLSCEPSVRTLTIRGSVSGNLDPVGNLLKLETLQILSVTGQVRLTFLSKLKKLNSFQLDVDYTNAAATGIEPSVADVSAIGSAQALTALVLAFVPMDNIDFLSRLSHLQKLSLFGSYTRTLVPLAALKELEEVHLDRISVSDIAPLLGLPSLKIVGLGNVPARLDEVNELKRRGVMVWAGEY